MTFCIPLISDVHVSSQTLSAFHAISVVDLDLRRAADRQKGITCYSPKPSIQEAP